MNNEHSKTWHLLQTIVALRIIKQDSDLLSELIKQVVIVTNPGADGHRLDDYMERKYGTV